MIIKMLNEGYIKLPMELVEELGWAVGEELNLSAWENGEGKAVEISITKDVIRDRAVHEFEPIK